jgi:hypothetical protein
MPIHENINIQFVVGDLKEINLKYLVDMFCEFML